jgi:hypothetical protein
MRAHELFERAAQDYYMHCTSIDHLESIKKMGLIPNKANKGQGNYEDFDWLSLDGVYATKQPEIIENYARAHSLHDYLIVLLAISPNSVLPDEDTINILLRKCYEEVCGWWGIDSYYDSFEHWADEHDHAPDEDGNVEEPDREKFFHQIAELFHEKAKTAGDPRPADMAMLEELVSDWAALAFTGGVESHPEDWRDLKDRVCRRYPRMGHPLMGHGWSIRIPDAVSYAGRNRIVGIVEVIDEYGRLVWGHIPDEAKPMVSRLFFNPL